MSHVDCAAFDVLCGGASTAKPQRGIILRPVAVRRGGLRSRASADTSRIDDPAAASPAKVQVPVESSIGGANAVAAHLSSAAGAHLASAAADAFTTALGYGLLVAAAVALLGAGVVEWKLPARHGAAPVMDAPKPLAALAGAE